ncbi:MAG TPA: PadR family transcriptional regulator [Streptomyces sp.]|nr:PadR family transcriptional regulator [Streptomyces sp.]
MPRQLNATAASLLGFLHEGPMSGWDLLETAQERIGGFWSLTPSQVYRELARLADDGLAEAGAPGPRARRVFTLTDDGREAFRRWLEAEPAPEQIRFPLLLTMAFGRHLPPERRAAILASHRAAHEERLAAYQEAQRNLSAGADAYAAATLDFGIRYERAVLDWFAHLPPEVAGTEAPGHDTL